jgi:hypothetical protein
MTATDDAVQELIDRAAIRDVMTRYARGLDRRDFDMVAGCFAPDATAEYSGEVLAPGVDAIVSYVRGLEHLPISMHFMGDMFIELDGDSAEVETYAIAYLVGAHGGSEEGVRVRGLRYRDRLARRQGGWAITHRVHTADWMFSSPSLPPGRPAGRPLPGTG